MAVRAKDAHHFYSSPYRLKKISAFGGKCHYLSPSVCVHKQNIGKNVLLIVANVPFFYIFVYLYYSMKFKKILKGPFLAPPAEKKLDPLPWAFGARPRMTKMFDEKKDIWPTSSN